MSDRSPLPTETKDFSPNPVWLSILRYFVFPQSMMVGLSGQQIQLVQNVADCLGNRQVGEAETLLAALSQAVEVESPILRVLQGILLVYIGRHLEAVQVFASLTDEYPAEPSLQLNHAMALAAAGRLARAAETLEEVSARYPQLDSVASPLAIIYGLLLEHEPAERWARRALTTPRTESANFVALVLTQSTMLLGRGKIEGAFEFRAGQDAPGPDRMSALLTAFPPVQGDSFEHGLNLPTIFVAADPVYWNRHVLSLLWSIIESRTRCVLHVHLYNPSAELLLEVERLRGRIRPFPLQVTFEVVDFQKYGGPRTYCSNARFFRLHQLMSANSTTVLVIDADMLVRRDLALVEGWDDSQASVGLTCYPTEPIWNRFAAGFAYFKPTDFGRQFLQRVAILIAHNLVIGRASWYLDQTALFEAYLSTGGNREHVHLLDGNLVCDLQYREESLVWCITTDKKAPRYVEWREVLLKKYASCTTYLDFRVETVKASFGPMMILSNDRYIGPSIKHRGVWCSNELELLRKLVPRRGVIVDGGANIGSHTVPLARLVGPAGRVLAFEPQRLVYYVLAGNVALNGLTQVECYNLGLSDTAGELGIDAPGEDQNFGCVPLSAGKRNRFTEVITTRTLDSFQLDRCDVIKLDIEGMELEAIQGARQTIENFHPILYLENHAGPKCQPLIDLVCRHGYRAYWHGVETNNPNLLCIHRSRPIVVDGLREAGRQQQ